MSGSAPPQKPWERNRPAGVGATSASASLASTPIPSTSATAVTGGTATATDITASRPVPSRPWEQPSVTPYGSTSPYSSLSTYGPSTSYGSTPYGSTLGSSSMYTSPYNRGMLGGGGMVGGYTGYGGGSMYGRPMYGAAGSYSGYGSTYGGGMYGSAYGGAYGSTGYGGAMGGPMGTMGPPGMDPNAQMPAPPSAWQHFLAAINGLMSFVGRLSFLVDENTHAMHFFISALLQLLDRAGSLYGELARFVLRLLGRRRKSAAKAGVAQPDADGKQLVVAGPQQLAGPMRVPPMPGMQQAAGPQWDNLWQR